MSRFFVPCQGKECYPQETTRPSMEVAIRNGDLAAVRYHLSRGNNQALLLNTYLDTAISSGNINIVDEFLRRGADINLESPRGTPLMVAVVNNDLPMVHHLLTVETPWQFVDVNKTIKFGFVSPNVSAMSMAAMTNNFPIAVELALNGASTENIPDEQFKFEVEKATWRTLRRSALAIQRASTHSLYQPGGPGYERSRQHFYELEESRRRY